MRKAMAFGVVAATVMLAACNHARSEDSGPSTSRNYAVGGFDAIDVSGPYDVEVRTGGNPSVSATGPQKMIEGMVVEVQAGRLLIHPQGEHRMFNISWGSNRNVRVQVTVPKLQGATLTGSGDMHVDHIQGPSFEGKLTGSGDLGVGSFDVQTLKLTLTGSGDVKAGSGRAQSVVYALSGSGDLDARGVQAQTADISVTGSGDASANATATANVSVMGSGDVSVTGGAKCAISKHGSGDVDCG